MHQNLVELPSVGDRSLISFGCSFGWRDMRLVYLEGMMPVIWWIYLECLITELDRWGRGEKLCQMPPRSQLGVQSMSVSYLCTNKLFVIMAAYIIRELNLNCFQEFSATVNQRRSVYGTDRNNSSMWSLYCTNRIPLIWVYLAVFILFLIFYSDGGFNIYR